jgi:resuscitation-promoting factor RpfB
MASGGLSALALAEIGAGAVLAWSGVQNASLKATVTSLIGGRVPQASTGTDAITSSAPATSSAAAAGDTTAHSASAAANQAVARVLAAPFGWSAGADWTDLVSLWNRESGWSSTIANPTSGALGIAQSLGHGTATSAGSLGNEYPSKAANDGSAAAQISWGLSYIRSQYGSPVAAWAHEESAGWY